MDEVHMTLLENGNIRIRVPMLFRLTGKKKYLYTPPALDNSVPDTPRPEETPVGRAILDGHMYYWMLERGEAENFQTLANKLGLDKSTVGRQIRLVNLAPDIIERVLMGDVPPKLTIERLKGNIPALWSEQRKEFLGENNMPKKKNIPQTATQRR